MAGPDSPPVPAANFGRRVSVSMAMPSSVLMRLTPVAPAATAARAMAAMSVTSGVSLANTGTSMTEVTASIAVVVASLRHANTMPLSSTLGHEMLTSTAEMSGLPDSRLASRPYSSTVLPAMLAMTGTCCAASHGRSLASHASTPGFCSPIALSMPLAVSAMRGGGNPARGSSVTDLVTTAPSVDSAKNRAISRPLAKHPLAVMTGFRNRSAPRSTPRFTSAAGMASITVSPPHRSPVDPLRVEHGTLDTSAHVALCCRHHTRHADADRAAHELLDGDLAVTAVAAREVRDGREHGHRAACKHLRRRSSVKALGQRSGDQTGAAPAAV